MKNMATTGRESACTANQKNHWQECHVYGESELVQYFTFTARSVHGDPCPANVLVQKQARYMDAQGRHQEEQTDLTRLELIEAYGSTSNARRVSKLLPVVYDTRSSAASDAPGCQPRKAPGNLRSIRRRYRMDGT